MDMEKSRQQLIGRLTENYADYRAELLLKDRQELIDGADRIAKTAEVFQYFTQHQPTEQEVSYFLKFQNPLEVAADHWESCEFELDALGAVMADTVDQAKDLTLYPLAVDAPERKPDGLQKFVNVDLENSRVFGEAVADRMNHQTERELSFRCQTRDCYAIYQLNRHDPDLRYIRYESLESLQQQGQRPRRGNYELVYTAPLPEGTGLNTLWTKFNTDHPADYRHPSMSVSDVIAVKKNGIVTCYYVDQFSFAVLNDFLDQRPRQAALSKPSIKEQLAAKPIPGDQPTAKTKNREVR